MRRGEEEKCHWDENKTGVQPQPFALRTEVETLKFQLQSMQTLLTSYLPNVPPLPAPPLEMIQPETSQSASTSPPIAFEDFTMTGETSAISTAEEVEKAANVLEEMALGAQLHGTPYYYSWQHPKTFNSVISLFTLLYGEN